MTTQSQHKVSTLKTTSSSDDRTSLEDVPAPKTSDSFVWDNKTWTVESLDDESKLARATSGNDSQRFAYEVIAQAQFEKEQADKILEERDRRAEEAQKLQVEAQEKATKEEAKGEKAGARS